MKNIIMIGLLILVCGCIHKASRQGYIDFINDPDNKILQQISIGGVTATAKWLSPEYRQLLSKSGAASGAQSDDAYYYFNVKFSKVEGDKPDKNKIMYLTFDMQGDFVLAAGRDSIPAAICQRIENGKGGSYEYMLAFEKNDRAGQQKKDRDFTLVYHDKIFSIGSIAFVYNQEDIKRIPALKKEITQ